MNSHLKSCIVAIFILAFLNPVRPQEKGMSYFLSAGKGLSLGEWGLRYTVAAGVESPIGSGFSIASSLNYLEYPFYDYPGLSRVVSHGAKSEISIASLVKLSAPWSIAPYIAMGLGLARMREGEVVKQSMSGGISVTRPETVLALYAGLKTGVEVSVLEDLVISANLAIGVGLSYLYSDNFSGQLGIRCWL